MSGWEGKAGGRLDMFVAWKGDGKAGGGDDDEWVVARLSRICDIRISFFSLGGVGVLEGSRAELLEQRDWSMRLVSGLGRALELRRVCGSRGEIEAKKEKGGKGRDTVGVGWTGLGRTGLPVVSPAVLFLVMG